MKPTRQTQEDAMKLERYTDIVFEIETAVKEIAAQSGFEYYSNGSSHTTCSSYFSLVRERDDETQELNVRISNHAPRYDVDDLGWTIDLEDGDYANDRVAFGRTYARLVPVNKDGVEIEFDDGNDEIDSKYVECDEDDEGAEFQHFEIDEAEIQRLAEAVVAAAKRAEWA